MDWEKAKQHFDEVKRQYLDVMNTPSVNVFPVIAFVFDPLEKRYNSGERSEELYLAMLSVE